MAGLFFCEIHGETSLLPVCKHLHQKMLVDDNPGSPPEITATIRKWG